MTREEAKKTLATTWTFECVGEGVLLRDVALIQAVLSREDERQHSTSPVSAFVGAQVPRSA